jgi:Putative MetA-pathway of phenol degradation
MVTKFRNIFILLFILSISISSFSQDSIPIQTDRPDQTECPFIVPKMYLQLENGLTYENIDKSTSSILLPTTLWRYGLTPNFELRMITELYNQKIGSQSILGLNPLIFGFKAKISDEKGIIPATAVIGHLVTPNWGSKEFSSPYFATTFRFNLQHTVSKRVVIAYNLGAEWDGVNAEPQFIYTLTSGIILTDALGFYLELYGFAPQKSSASHKCDGGFTYLVNNNFMFDISSGYSLTDTDPNYYGSLGCSFRFNTKAKK